MGIRDSLIRVTPVDSSHDGLTPSCLNLVNIVKIYIGLFYSTNA